MPDHLSPAEVAALLAPSTGRLALDLIGTAPTTRTGTEWRWRAKGSLAVHVAGPKQGRFFDNEAGVHGDALAMVAHLRGCRMRDAYRWALEWLGNPIAAAPPPPSRPPDRPKRQPEADADKLHLAMKLWAEAVPVLGSPAQRYLTSRLGLDLNLPADADIDHPLCFFIDLVFGEDSALRFHPGCPRGAERLPAMVALMNDPASGKPCGIHRTFLRPDGTGKAPGQAKMMLGGAGVVRLVPDAEVTVAVGIAEGIETALAVMHRYEWRPVWAAGSAGGIASFPVLPGIETLTIFPDADDGGASKRAAGQCAARWRAAGREVGFIAPPAGADFANLTERAA